MEWISVKEKLPEIPRSYYSKEYDATLTPLNIPVLVWDGQNVREESFGIIPWDDSITHWMPLPEPPK